MDANEFFNMLFDRLDNCLDGSSLTPLLTSFLLFSPLYSPLETDKKFALRQEFGGTFSHQLICLECPHSSSREEPFYSMSVATKNKGTS